jgi:glucokinase
VTGHRSALPLADYTTQSCDPDRSGPHSKIRAAFCFVDSQSVEPNSTDHLVCAVDLGGTNLRAANIDREGRIHERVRSETPDSNQAENVVSAIASAISECEAEAAQRNARIDAVSVVVPGSVEATTGVVVNAPNLPAIVGFRLSEALNAKLERPVMIENDANAAAIGEMWQGAARGCRTIICLTLGTGVGSGIILDGELWRGVDGTAGEIGHTSVDPFGGVRCKCGNVGCLEVCASATAVVRMTREKLEQSHQSRLQTIPENELSGESVYRAATEGDELALGVFKRVGTYLGVAMAGLVNIFNPEMIVVGGGLSGAFDLFAPLAREEIMRRAFPVPARRCRIARAECGDDAGLLGAAWLAFQNKP